MDIDEAYFQCLIEEYKQCKSEIIILQKYQWRVQMLYVPTLIITIIGFYMTEIWSVDPANKVQLSSIIQNLFSDQTFITLILWSALMSILIVLYTGNMMIQEGRYIKERLIPKFEKLLQKKELFYWERICTERLPISKHRDDSLQLYGGFIFGSLLLILPLSIGLMCIYQGFINYHKMTTFMKAPFITGTIVFTLSMITAGIGLILLEIRRKRALFVSKDKQKDKDSYEHNKKELQETRSHPN